MAPNPIANSTFVSARHGFIRIERIIASPTTPREYGEQFYILTDATGARVGRTYRYLVNARRQARRIAAES